MEENEPINIENFDPDMLFPPSEEKIKIRNEIIDKFIISFGIQEGEKIIHFGCGSRNLSFLKYTQSIPINYMGIDIDPDVISKCQSLIRSDNMSLSQMTMQEFMDKNLENDVMYNWSVIDGLLDKNLYGEYQYEFVDTILRRSLIMSTGGVIVVMDSNPTKDDDGYNPDFMMAYISSMYNRFSFNRLNEHQYIFAIFKYYI